MLALDSAAIESGIPSIDLMERAGKGVVEAVKKRFSTKGLISVVVGKGNNGGDGLVTARYLKEDGFNVAVFLLASWTEFKGDTRTNWDRLAGKEIDVFEIISEGEIKKHLKKFEESVCIVDAIFGTGLAGEVKGKYKSAIEFINKLVKPVVSVDVPSGLSSDTGKPLGAAIRAKLTVTFGLPKVGLVTNTGSEYAREIEIVDIGIPDELIKKTDTKHYLITPDMFVEYFGSRKKDVHKGSFGHALIIGGSTGKIGAGLIASRAALRTGCGLVTYALPKTAYAKFDTRSPEVMYEAIEDEGKGVFGKSSKVNLKNKTVVALGPGIGTESETKKFVLEIVKKSAAPLVIDADGLNCVAADSISGRKNPIVLTPHPGEMSKLTGKSTGEIQGDRIAVAREFAAKHKVYVVLKGYRTVVANPEGDIFINPTGNPGLATAGTGDCLTGVIAGFISQGIPLLPSVIAGVYVHGLAGDMAAEKTGERGLIASDIINNLPNVLKLIANIK